MMEELVMMKRALGVLAALSMVVGSVACSSSSDSAPSTVKDTGTSTDAKDSGSDVVVVPGDGDTTDTDVPTDKTTGLLCMTDDDCDKTAAGIAHCSNSIGYVVGPLNPSAICLQIDSSDVCTPTDDTTIHFCDGNLGLCTKAGMNPATCEGACIMSADGTMVQKCAGNNGCNTAAFGTDEMTMKISLIGTCQSGCKADADCPSGSKCDPVQKFCSKTCTSTADCTKGWTGAPANWVCNTTRGACEFTYPKKLGDTCASADDCLCFKNSTEANGYCIDLCRAGDGSCGTGFTCDALLPKKDDKGGDLFTLTTQPADLVGYCLKNCAADTDCPANQMCDQSAGLTQKTCRPKSTTADGG
jgi:hypothetical protein